MTARNLTDDQRLAAMRELGVVWPKGRLPRYPSSMTGAEQARADALYDQISPAFVEKHMTKGRL